MVEPAPERIEVEDNEEQVELKQKKDQEKRQKEVNEMMTTQLGLYKRGAYVKITLQGFNTDTAAQIRPEYPIILARINVGEDNLGFLKVCVYIPPIIDSH